MVEAYRWSWPKVLFRHHPQDSEPIRLATSYSAAYGAGQMGKIVAKRKIRPVPAP